jgi:CRP-like cAMP-binding protein
MAQRFFFDRLAISYDSAVGFVMAQEETLKLLESMMLSSSDPEEKKTLETIENEINENRIHGLTYLRNIRNSYPEVYTAISTRQAIRAMLNSERHTVERLVQRGRIDGGEASRMMHSIEVRMKQLLESPPSFDLPQTVELLRSISWLKDMEEQKFKEVVELFQDRVYSVDQPLVKVEGKDEGLFVIVRGNVKVSIGNQVVDVLGPGSVVGEMSILTDNPKSASVTAESPVTVMWISNSKMKRVLRSAPELEDKLWSFAGRRIAENFLRNIDRYGHMSMDAFRDWIAGGKMSSDAEGQTIKIAGQITVLLSGKVKGKNGEIKSAPAFLEDGDIVSSSSARLFYSEES